MNPLIQCIIYCRSNTAAKALSPVIYSLLLTSCAIHGPDYKFSKSKIYEIDSSSFHHNIQQGIANTLKLYIKTKDWNENTQFSLMPAGPYVTHRQTLNSQPLAITSNGQYTYVATRSSARDSDSDIEIIKFTADGKSETVSSVNGIKGVITKLFYKNNSLIITFKHGGVNLLNVSSPVHPVNYFNFPTNSPVLDIQQGKQTDFLLLENNTLLEIQLPINSKQEIKNLSSEILINSWKLPVNAKSISVDKKYIWLAGSQGIASVKLTGTSAKLIDLYKTSGTPLSIQLKNNLALVADGPGGLIVFRTTDKGQLQWLGSYNKRGAITAISTDKSNNVLATLGNGSIMSLGLANPELPSSGSIFKAEHPLLATQLINSSNTLPQQTSALATTKNSLLRVVMTGDNRQLISPEGVNQGGSRRAVIRDNILYVADWFSGLHLYDISKPDHIKHLSNYHTPGSSKGVTLMSNYALIGDDDQGLQIIDIQNPRQPRWVSELAPESLAKIGLAYTMKLVGNTLYLADHRGGFHIIDLSEITTPKRLGGFNTPGKSWGIDVSDHHVFVADDSSGLLVFDASNLKNPELVGQFNPGGQAEDILIQNDLAYVTFFDKGLYILDIRKAREPKIIGHVSIPGNARGLALKDNLAYIAGWESGLQVVDISNPGNPHIIGSYDTDGSAWGVNIKNNFAYVLDWWGGLKVIDVQQPSKPTYHSQYHARDTLQQLRTKNKYLFAASGSGGLQVFDIKNPLNPIWTTGVDFNGKAQDIWLDDDRAYVAAGDGGIMILDTLDPFYTRRITQFTTPGQALRVRAWNELLYIQDSLVGLIVFDVRNPQRPLEIARYTIEVSDLWIDDKALWVSTAQGLVWWEHSDSGALLNKKLLTIPDGSHWVRTQNDLVVSAHQNGIISFWRDTPHGLRPIGQHNTGEPISDFQLEQDAIYVLGNHSGLMTINITNPKLPRLTAVYPPAGTHTRMTIAQGAAFFAGVSRLSSVALLPSTAITSNISSSTPDEIDIKLSAEIPVGKYHIMATTPSGQRKLLPNAINVQFSSSEKGKSSLQNMRQLLKTPLKPPTEP